MNVDGQAKHYLTDRQGFESTARYWTEVSNSFLSPRVPFLLARPLSRKRAS